MLVYYQNTMAIVLNARDVFMWHKTQDDITTAYEPAANVWVITPIAYYLRANYVRKWLDVISVNGWGMLPCLMEVHN